MALSILRNGVPLDQLYGTKGASTAAATGCLQNGVDVNQYLLALADGKALGFNAGLSKNGTDFSAIFGIPTGNTPLPINGGTYNAVLTRNGSSGARCTITFTANASTWVLAPSGAAGTISPSGNFASGSIPSGATSVSYTWSNISGSVSPSNTPLTALTSSPSAIVQCTSAGTIGTSSGSATLTIVFYNSGGTAISTTTCNLGVSITN